MIIYSANCERFSQDVQTNQIDHHIIDVYKSKLGRKPPPAEINAWRNSLQYMDNALSAAGIPGSAGVAIEYQIPLTSKRIDFLLSGEAADGQDSVVIVELKQWDTVHATEKDAIVKTILGGSLVETTHPSYQAWTYTDLIRDYNVAVQEGDISLQACAYLHNCTDASVVKSSFYAEHTHKAPVYLRNDVQALSDFLREHVRAGDRNRVLYRIENSRIKPSKNLADHLASLLEGNSEFDMIDDQKVVYEAVLQAAERAQDGRKQVVLVQGGPGTGKSVIAINLLVELTRRERIAQYVTRNAAPRAVYQSKLTGKLTKTRISNLFKNSGAYVDSKGNSLDCLVVDEAHRLNEKSGLFQNLGVNQIAEIIHAAKATVFFLDQDQRVTIKDIGDRDEIVRHTKAAGAELTELKLVSQFRCNGSDGYLSWINNTFQVEETANKTLTGINYDFRVFDDPNELRSVIEETNAENNKSRMLAGYCWDWKGKTNPEIEDVTIPEFGFSMRWNLNRDGSLWIVAPDSVSEIGCIHTCQGLEVDYVGVIIGPDLVVRDGIVVTDADKRSSQDRSIFGYKKMSKENLVNAKAIADRIIKNTYRTLMTRGQKGCYVYSVDEETNEYLKLASTRS